MGDSNLVVGMTWIDWAIVFVMVMSVVAGLAQGFFRSICSLGGLVLGLALAAWNYRIVAAPLQRLVGNEEVAARVHGHCCREVQLGRCSTRSVSRIDRFRPQS